MINGLYEGFGALFVLATCRNLWKSKQPWGVSIVGICFFTSWGIWNLYYYPHLHQWYSFFGGVCIVLSNALYVYLLIWLRKHYPLPLTKDQILAHNFLKDTCQHLDVNCDELVCYCSAHRK